MKTIELRINETGRSSLCKSDPPSCFNNIKESFPTLDELKEYLIERYGYLPQGRMKIYRDTLDKDGKFEPAIVGFLHSWWNQDVSHNSKKWLQTDWIEIYEQETIRTYNIKLK